MPLEIEFKYKVRHVVAIEKDLVRLKAKRYGAKKQRDLYFNHPSKNFAETGEAFRLRLDDDTPKITYKGPRLPSVAKVRQEIEISLARPEKNGKGRASLYDTMKSLLLLLGFRPVGEVAKERKVFRIKRGAYQIEIACDKVRGLGSFVELEIVTSERQREAAVEVLSKLAGELKLIHHEKRSYLTMLLQKAGHIPSFAV